MYKATTKLIAASSYQSLFSNVARLDSSSAHCYPKHYTAALKRALYVPSHNRIVLHWNRPVSDIYPRFPSDYGNIQKVMHLTPLASQLLRGSLAAALIACDGFITLGL